MFPWIHGIEGLQVGGKNCVFRFLRKFFRILRCSRTDYEEVKSSG